MTPFASVVERLRGASIPHAVIGASALAVHGIPRSTADVDVLVVDETVLRRRFWESVERGGASVELRLGDASDPLAGLVRIDEPQGVGVDVVVGRSGWMAQVLRRAVSTRLGGVDVPVVDAADLVLLKLYAGGPQDAWDVTQLLSTPAGDDIARTVEERLGALPVSCVDLWRRVRSG